MDKYTYLKSVIGTAMREDLEWIGHGRIPGQKPDPIRNPWMPFQAAEFIAMLAEVLPESAGCDFLDVGSGIGTKIMLAEELFNLNAWGIETDEVMARHANYYGRYTELQDALTCSDYNDVDIIWLYRPFRDRLSQVQLEHRVFSMMKPGTIVFGGAWESQPRGFEIIVDDWDTGHRGAYRKPVKWEDVIYDIDADELLWQ